MLHVTRDTPPQDRKIHHTGRQDFSFGPLLPTWNMSITVEVALLSGKSTKVEVSLTEDVATLKLRAQTALGVAKGRLVGSSGCVLDCWASIKHAGVQNGDSLTWCLKRVQVQADRSGSAMAATLGDGSVASWGLTHSGGDSTRVQNQLKSLPFSKKDWS